MQRRTFLSCSPLLATGAICAVAEASPDASMTPRPQGVSITSIALAVKAENQKVYGTTLWAGTSGSPGAGHDNMPPKNPLD